MGSLVSTRRPALSRRPQTASRQPRPGGGAAVERRSRADVVADGVQQRSAPMTIDDYANLVGNMLDEWNTGNGNITTTWRNEPAERIGTSMTSLAQQAYRGNGLAFAVISVRMTAFSLVRFSWQRIRKGRPTDLFGTPALALLESPWPGGTTADLLARMLLDVDLAGNAYVVREASELMRLRPDWVQIILAPVVRQGAIVGYKRVGYTYHHGGIDVCPPEQVALYAASEVAHFAPYPDPDASYRGMSWLNPIVSELGNDKAMESHKRKFFENAATPNLSVSLDKAIDPEDFAAFKELMEEEHGGVENAYKTLYLGGGADVKVVGANFDQLRMNDIQGRGETRVAAAGGVPAIIVGLSEGLSSATYSNYGQAMRRFADLTMTDLWGKAAGALSTILRPPGADARLWFDTRDVAFLREDRKVAAEVQAQQAQTIRTLLDAGFTPETVIPAVEGGDWGLLVHSGLFSVQLQPIGANGTVSPDEPAPAADDPEPEPEAESGSSSGGASSTNAADPDVVDPPEVEQWPHRVHGVPVHDFDHIDRALIANGRHPVLNGATYS